MPPESPTSSPFPCIRVSFSTTIPLASLLLYRSRFALFSSSPRRCCPAKIFPGPLHIFAETFLSARKERENRAALNEEVGQRNGPFPPSEATLGSAALETVPWPLPTSQPRSATYSPPAPRYKGPVFMHIVDWHVDLCTSVILCVLSSVG